MMKPFALLALISSVSIGALLVALGAVAFPGEVGDNMPAIQREMEVEEEIMEHEEMMEHMMEHAGMRGMMEIEDFEEHGMEGLAPLIGRLKHLASHLNITIDISLVTIEGTFRTISGRLLLIEVGSDVIPIIAPRSWLVDNEIKSLIQLFANDVINEGDTLRIDAINISISIPDEPSVNFIIAKKIDNITNNKVAVAVLPFSIEQP